jgi:hypothetical protein
LAASSKGVLSIMPPIRRASALPAFEQAMLQKR